MLKTLFYIYAVIYYFVRYYLLLLYLTPKIYGKNKNSLQVGQLLLKGRSYIKFEKKSSHNKVIIGDNVTFKSLRVIFRGNYNTLVIEDNVNWGGDILIHDNNRTVRIGKNSTSKNVYLLSRDNDVSIGENCMFSRGIEIRATDVHKIYDLQSNKQLNKPSDVVIGNYVWVAAKVTISKGALIADGSVVGANSFVNKKFTQSNCVIAGSPAKIVKESIRWKR